MHQNTEANSFYVDTYLKPDSENTLVYNLNNAVWNVHLNATFND